MRSISLRVLCEGQTEQRFVSLVLAPHLRARAVFAKPELLVPGRGGVVSFGKLRYAIKTDIGRSREHEYVTTMIDLYGISDYPGAEKRVGESGVERAQRIEAAMSRELPNPRFLPYIQVHEFEALLFVDLDQLPAAFPDGEAREAPGRLRQSIGNARPEDVDDGGSTAPSKRIIGEVAEYAAMKRIAGPLITERIGLPRLREGCPHFGAWVARLEGLAGQVV